VITKHKKLERDHQEVKEMVTKLQEQLDHAKKEARIREEEAKHAQKRLVGCHYHFKKLQDEHEVILQRVKDQETELRGFRCDASFLEDASNT
jgi:chromosome segregation ATPase